MGSIYEPLCRLLGGKEREKAGVWAADMSEHRPAKIFGFDSIFVLWFHVKTFQ